MNDQSKTKDELIKELQDLKQAHCFLKESYDKEINRLHLEKNLLQKKRSSMDAVFDSSPAAMMIIDETTKIRMVNFAAKKLCGIDEAQILNHRTGNALNCIHSSKDPRGCGYSNDCKFCEIRYCIDALIANGGSVHGAEFELNLIRNGEEKSIWMNVGLTPLLLEDKKHWCMALDEITKSKKTEAYFQESQLLLKSSIESMKDTLVLSINKDYKYLYFNKLHQYVMLNSFGLKINLAMNMLDCLINEDDRAKWKNNFDRALNGESHTTIEEYGAIDRYYYETRYNPIFNDQKEIIGATAFSVNITGRKKAEEALWKSEQRWRKLVQTIPDYVALYDRDGKYLFINRFAEGFSMKDIEGKTFNDFLAEESKSQYVEAFNQALQTNTTQYLEYMAFGDNMTMRNYESHFIPIMENGQFENMMVIARDVTERKLAQEELKSNEAIFNQFLEHSPIYIFFKDENIRSLRLSRNYEKMIGKPLDELLGKSMNELFPSELAKNMVENDLQILRDGFKIEVDEELNNRHYSTIKFPIQIEGKSKFLAGFTIDITERKQAEEALRVSEERFRVMLQSAPSVCVQGYSTDGTIQYWNQASELLYGYSTQEAIGKNILDLIIPPEIRNEVARAIRQMAETGRPLPSSEWSLMRKDGSRVSVFSSHAVVESPGKPKEMFSIDIDLSDRIEAENALKDSEELNRLLFENSAEAILFTQPDGTVYFANNEACRIFGRSKTEMNGLGRSEFVDPNDSRLAPALEERKRTGKFKGELNMVRSNGTIFPVEVSSTVFKDSKGNDRTSLIIIDITERKNAEEKLKENQVHLNELIANKDKFFSIIAHDLRNPFNSFLGLTQIMAEELPSLKMSQVQEIAVSMSKSATKLYGLLENLLQWSQIQQGAMPFNPQMVQLAMVVQESIEMIQDAADKKGIEIVSRIPVPMPVFVDVNMIQSVIRNLVSNAVKFTKNGGNISLSARPTNDNKIEICVLDTGIGISQTMIDNLFRIDVKTNRKGTNGELSTGLGLLLCKEFIEKHKGQFWVESEVEKGTSFCFNLPLQFIFE